MCRVSGEFPIELIALAYASLYSRCLMLNRVGLAVLLFHVGIERIELLDKIGGLVLLFCPQKQIVRRLHPFATVYYFLCWTRFIALLRKGGNPEQILPAASR